MANARSLTNKFDEFVCLVQSFDSDIVCVSETWFSESIPQSVYNIPRYSLFSKHRTVRRGGGVAIFAKTDMNPTHVKLHVPEEHEIVWTQIRPSRLPRSVSSIYIASIYSPPDNTHADELVQYLTYAVDEILSNHPTAGIIIMGDFNRTDVSPLLRGQNLKQVVNRPTRNQAVLDKIVTNLNHLYSPVHIVAPLGHSDHNGVTWLPKKQPPHKNKVQHRVVRPFRESSVRPFGSWITHHDWSNVYDENDVERKCEHFYNELNTAINLYFQCKTIRLHATDKPWMTVGVKGLINQRQTAFHNNSSNQNNLRNKVQREICHAKEAFYRDRVQHLKHENPSAWYRYIKVMSSNMQQDMSIALEDVDATDSVAIANAINSYFVSIAKDTPPLAAKNIPAYRPFPLHSIPSVQPWSVYKELSKTHVGKSGGPDGISPRLIREFAVELSSPLCNIFNASFEQGKVPSCWKKSLIVPVPKENPPTLHKLRPIALTDFFAKLLELFAYKWLMADISPVIDSQQFGNRSGLSTSHYLLNLLEYLHSNADKSGSITTVVLTDFSKAFDLVDHNVAINKLFTMGARPSLIPWVCSFLTERTQQVRYKNQLSRNLTTSAGVPQGTRLGPLIFLAVVNDALQTSDCHRWKYVDDLTVAETRRVNSPCNLDTTLSSFEQWCEESNMRLNPTKCQVMQISFARRQLPPPEIKLLDQIIPESQHVKLLGVIVRNDLRWTDHVNNVTSRATKKLYILRMLKRFAMPTTDLLTVFTSYIRPILEYCCVVWHFSLTLHQENQLERIQKRALRTILAGGYESYQRALSACDLVSLKERREDLCRVFANKLFKNFRHWLPESQSSNRQLRHSNRLRELKCRTQRYKNSAIPQIIKLLNSK
ncbi:uncharacterized protein LOC100889248 [Strongylocentrotus purpuratus]|uniref:Reverse transcriptase domain-containing protein n=1 Tax=Strongylocentrotus purpuratus TaxID=7668 RepID=A0A7M7T4T5_STRPU|nr:uncharacterized protein LOC100889248 [Strongylocentrotus purpuratus]